MQTVGNATSFLSDIIPDKFVPEILDLVVGAWERMPALQPNQREPRITALLRGACIAEYECRYRGQAWPFWVAHEAQLFDPSTGREIARTDLEIGLRHHNIPGQRPYFTFEAKKLNIPDGKRVRSNATEYVGDGGMMCFINGRYAPVYCGMLGYVMDGNIPTARASVAKATRHRRRRLRLTAPYQLVLSQRALRDGRFAESKHIMRRQSMTMYHIFLARSH